MECYFFSAAKWIASLLLRRFSLNSGYWFDFFLCYFGRAKGYFNISNSNLIVWVCWVFPFRCYYFQMLCGSWLFGVKSNWIHLNLRTICNTEIEIIYNEIQFNSIQGKTHTFGNLKFWKLIYFGATVFRAWNFAYIDFETAIGVHQRKKELHRNAIWIQRCLTSMIIKQVFSWITTFWARKKTT